MEELENKPIPEVEALDKELDKIAEEVQDADTEEQVQALEKKVDEIEEERKLQIANAEKRSAELRKAIESKSIVEKVESEEKRTMDTEKEYRKAYFKKLMGKEMTEEERALVTSSTTAVIPEESSNMIFEKAVKLVPLLNEIELFHVNGSIKFAVETTRANAGYHTENSTGINVDATAVLTEVKLGGYEFTKLIQVSDSLLHQSVDAFEEWLTTMLATSIATIVEHEIINGTGSSTVKGINAISYVNKTNAIQYNASTGLTAQDVRDAEGLLPALYDAGSKWLMKKKTLFNKFMGLQDNAKCDIVRVEGNKYYVYGKEVILSDEVTDGVAFLGNFKKYVGNMSQDITVKSGFDIDTNSYKFLGVCEFDGKPAAEDAFIKVAASL